MIQKIEALFAESYDSYVRQFYILVVSGSGADHSSDDWRRSLEQGCRLFLGVEYVNRCIDVFETSFDLYDFVIQCSDLCINCLSSPHVSTATQFLECEVSLFVGKHFHLCRMEFRNDGKVLLQFLDHPSSMAQSWLGTIAITNFYGIKNLYARDNFVHPLDIGTR
jgi:hypothetical protein